MDIFKPYMPNYLPKGHIKNTDLGYQSHSEMSPNQAFEILMNQPHGVLAAYPDEMRELRDKIARSEKSEKEKAQQCNTTNFSQVPQTPLGLGIRAEKFALVPASLINKATYEEAHRAAAFARKELRLPPVTIEWFCPYEEAVFRYGDRDYKTFENDRDLAGVFKPKIENTIFLRVQQNAVDLQKTAMHELYHMRQQMSGIISGNETVEKFAYGYEHDCVRRFFEADRDELDDLYLRHLCGEDWSE